VPRRSLSSALPGSGAIGTNALPDSSTKEFIMLYTVAVVLLILWLLGLVTANTLGGFIHVLLVIAVVIVLLRVISGKNPL
jgi:hypothetical protein